MVLPIFVSLERLDRSFLEASRDLGAGPIATLRQIVLPLAAPGILTGFVLVFIPVMGEYLIPILLGGGKTYFLGNALADLFLQSRNWPFGSALATVFVIGMIVLVALAISRLSRAARPIPAGRPASCERSQRWSERLHQAGTRRWSSCSSSCRSSSWSSIRFNDGRHVTQLTRLLDRTGTRRRGPTSS